MSTGPGPTRKPDGSSGASVDDIADLLVEEAGKDPHEHPAVEQALDDSLDVMLETPGPSTVGTFMPPPPSLPHATDDNSSETEDRENAEEPSGESNLAYEDLLAKLVLPAGKPAEPKAVEAPPPLPMPELVVAPLPPALEQLITPAPTPAPAFKRPSANVPLVATSTDERTLVTENPLLAEEQEAAAREGRTTSHETAPRIQDELRPAVTEPVSRPTATSNTKAKLVYFFAGGLVMLVGMGLAVLVFKVFLRPSAPEPTVVAPAPAALPSPAPARVEPLPSTPPQPSAEPVAVPAAAPAAEPAAAASEEPPAAAIEEPPAAEAPAKVAPKPHKAASKKPAHAAAKPAAPAPTRPAPAAKPAATVAKVASPAAKPAKPAAAGKKPKSSGYADPFD